MNSNTIESQFRSFVEKSDVTLTTGQLIKLHTDGTAMAATADAAIGSFVGRLQGSKDVKVALFGPTVCVVQEGAIAVGADCVQGDTATKVKTSVAGGKIIGTKLYPASNGSAGDIIEIMLSGVGKSAGLALTKSTGIAHGNANGAIGALTSSATTTQAEFNALRDACETLADDLRSLQAAFVASGLGALS